MLNDIQPSLILFDLDGTLIDSAPDIHAALNACLESLGLVQSSLIEVQNWIGNGSKKLVERALIAKYRDFVDAETNAAFFNIAHASFLDFYQNNVAEKTVVYAGVEETLSELQNRNMPMALITNKPIQPTQKIVESLNWTTYFDVILGGDSLAHKKPHPEPLIAACERSNVDISSALMVGDSVNDIQAARAAGCKVLAVSYGYNHGQPVILEKPDYLVSDLRELLGN